MSDVTKGSYEKYSDNVAVRWFKEPNVWADIPRPARLSYQALETLSETDPLESAEFQESQARQRNTGCKTAVFLTPWLAHYPSMARNQGIGLKDTKLVVYFQSVTASGQQGVASHHDLVPQQHIELYEMYYMESLASILSDETVIDNRALLQELQDQAKEYLPSFLRMKSPHTVNVLPLPARFFDGGSRKKSASSGEMEKTVIFRGPLTMNNGLGHFISALKRMHKYVTESQEVNLVFVGNDYLNDEPKYRKGASAGALMGTQLIYDHLGHMQGYHLSVFTQKEDISMAKTEEGIVAILQSPGTGGGVRLVLEAVLTKTAFVAYNSTLNAFLVSVGLDPPDHDAFFESHGIPDPSHDIAGGKLAKTIWNKFKDSSCTPSKEMTDKIIEHSEGVRKRMIHLMGRPPNPNDSSTSESFSSIEGVRVSVCIVYHNRPVMVMQALSSIHLQTHKNIEVIVVVNSEEDEEEDATLKEIKDVANVVVMLETEVSLSEARNIGAGRASGEYIMFMDDDNVAKPREVEILLMVAKRTKAAIVAPGDEYFVGEESPYKERAKAINKWIPLGASPSMGIFQDAFGDANSLFLRSSFEAHGGFEEHKKVASSSEGEMAWATGEDWELMARMVLAGEILEVLPIALFWYRISEDALSKQSSRYLYLQKVMQPYVQHLQSNDKGADFVLPALKFAQNIYHNSPPNRNDNALDKLLFMLRSESLSNFEPSCKIDRERADRKPRNLLQNEDFKLTTLSQAKSWEAFMEGYEISTYVDGIRMISKSNHEQHGAKQIIVIDKASRKRNRPIFVAAQSTLMDGRGGSDPQGYSIYVDLEYEDQSMGYGFSATFLPDPRSDADLSVENKGSKWRCAVIVPSKPVLKIHFHLLFRYQKGTVIFHRGVAHYLDMGDVCDAFLSEGSHASTENSTANGTTSGILHDCGGRFTRQTPILM